VHAVLMLTPTLTISVVSSSPIATCILLIYSHCRQCYCHYCCIYSVPQCILASQPCTYAVDGRLERLSSLQAFGTDYYYYVYIYTDNTRTTAGIQQEVTSWDGVKECQLILVQAIPKHAVAYISMHALQWQYIAIAMQFLKGILLLLISLKAYRMFEKVVLKNTSTTSPKKYTNSNNTTQGLSSTQKSSSGHARGFFSSMKAAFTVADSETGNNSSRKFSSANNSPSPRERAQSSQTFCSENHVASGGARTQRGSTSVTNGAVRDVRAASAAGSVSAINESVHKKKRELGSGSNFKAAKVHIEESEPATEDPAVAAEQSEL
jgi:hypothetical protein